MKGCSFCLQPDHHIYLCPIAMDYVFFGRAIVVEDKICLSNGQHIHNNRSGQGIKVSIDRWLTSQNPPPPPPKQHTTPPAYIREVAETNILQIAQITQVQTLRKEQCEDKDLNIFQVFTAKKKKRESKAIKVPELANPLPARQVNTATTHAI
jgi:hypothetical protein